MAREMKSRIKHFSIEHSDAIEENERILEAGRQKRQENREAKQAEKSEQAKQEDPTEQVAPISTSVSAAQEPTQTETPTNSFALPSKKTANGIVVNVPMEDYMQLTMMKFQTGRTLKDLALQAIHEFVERNK